MKLSFWWALGLVAHDLSALAAFGQAVPDCPPGIPDMLRWHRYPYEIASSYPYLKRLPDWSRIPDLLAWIERDDGDGGGAVAYSQLVALSRADFGHPIRPQAGGLPADLVRYHQLQRRQAWAHWWDSVGTNYVDRLRTNGRRNPIAWNLVVGTNRCPLPDYLIAVPDEWVLRTTYGAGDYDGRQTESLTLRRSKTRATLIRALRKSTYGRLEWEMWPLTIREADDFAFALAYAIDNPWLVQPIRDESSPRRLPGRSLSLYYPGFEFELVDSKGDVWWNDDPRHWYGAQSLDGNFMGADGLGSACLILWRVFPDSTAARPSRWRPIDKPDAVVLAQLVDDLNQKVEVLRLLSSPRRISDALEALAEFGTKAEISALDRFEAELSARVNRVRAILDQDINGKNYRMQLDRLLQDSEKAKANILQRHGPP